MYRIPVTKVGLEKLKSECDFLEKVERKSVTQAIQDARAHGDLSENAEYKSAKEKQAIVEKRISYLTNRIDLAEVIDTSKFIGSDKIVFGAFVTIKRDSEEDSDEIHYQIVGEDEADINEHKISITAPIARALIGKKKNEICELISKDKKVQYKILDVKYS